MLIGYFSNKPDPLLFLLFFTEITLNASLKLIAVFLNSFKIT